MNQNEIQILKKLDDYLANSKYKIYPNSIKSFADYVQVNYQSKSVVDFNIPDDDMIYGIGTLIYRLRDGKIFELYTHANEKEQIVKILASD